MPRGQALASQSQPSFPALRSSSRVMIILFSSSCVRSLCAAVNTYHLACLCCPVNCSYVLYSNKIAFLMDLLLHQLTVSCDRPANILPLPTGMLVLRLFLSLLFTL